VSFPPPPTRDSTHICARRSGPVVPPPPPAAANVEEEPVVQSDGAKTPGVGRGSATPAVSRRGSLHPGNAGSSNGTPAP
jgi:hypothetical protein